MKIKPCVPQTLPLRSLNWESFADLLGKAHAALARYDETFKRAADKRPLFALLTDCEAITSIQSKTHKVNLKTVSNYKRALLKGARMIKRHPFSQSFFCEIHAEIKKTP